jgi:hypothetical protein
MRGTLGITPGRLMRGDVALGAVPERDGLCRIELRREPCRLAPLDRIEPIEPLFPCFARPFASIGQPYGVERA